MPLLHNIVNFAIESLVFQNRLLALIPSEIKNFLDQSAQAKSLSQTFFSWVLLNSRTTDQPTTQRLAESINIIERLDNGNMFILQNTSTVGKTYNYTLVYYPKSLLVSIKHIRRNQLYLFF